MAYSPPGSSVHGILQAKIPEWVAVAFSRGSSQPRDGTRIASLTSPALQGGSLALAPPGGQHAVNFFNLVRVSVSAKQLQGRGSEYYV